MAQKTITELTEVSASLTDSDVVAIQRSGQSTAEKITISDLKSAVNIGADNYGGTHLSVNDAPNASADLTKITVTASATPHTKGSWTTVISSTTQEFNLLELQVSNTLSNGADSSTLLDIAIGGAGSEVAIVENIGVGYKNVDTSTLAPQNYVFPVVAIPSGTRISVRIQSVTASKTADVRIIPSMIPPSHRTPLGIDTIGADTATSKGVALTVGGVANVKNGWTQITGSSANRYYGITLSAQGNADLTMVAGTCLVDIGVGALGAEQVVVSNVNFASTTSETWNQRAPNNNFFYVDIPAGSRISVRYGVSNVGNMMDVILHGAK